MKVPCFLHRRPFTGLIYGVLSVALMAAQTEQPASTAGGNFDGPAELPRVHVKSSLADTPAPGHRITVKEGDNLQNALNRAECGDTLELQAGATFSGLFRFPARKCDDAHWIIVRSSARDQELPPEGTRITPCYSGISSLPGRPFHCAGSPSKAMARVVFTLKGSGPIVFSDGANHYRLIGLEVTRESPQATIYNLISLEREPGHQGAADHLVFDRMWIHGVPQDETTRGVMLGGSRFVAVVDSFFTDFHCTAMSGACTDAQAIAGGIGGLPMGPYKIVNNFLEAAGESILFGGDPATETPADIEIRHNYMFKPLEWMPGSPDFVGAADGHAFIVKNLFELKNAQRVLFEGNILENTWGGFTQSGFGLLLTPKNQIPNVCPICVVTDVTVRYCRISHVGSGLQIGNGLSGTGGASKAGERYSIHDIVVDDIIGKPVKGFGAFAQVSMAKPTLHDVKMDHITAFPPEVLFIMGGPLTEDKMFNFSFTNSIASAGGIQIVGTGGGPQNCSFAYNRKGPEGVMHDCFASYTFENNVIIGGGGWPKGNHTVGSPKDVGFVNFNNGRGGDYRLLPTSRFKRSASGGRDPGADIDAIESHTAGVQ